MSDHPKTHRWMGSKRVLNRSHGVEGHIGHTVNLQRMQLGQHCLSGIYVLVARRPAHVEKSPNSTKVISGCYCVGVSKEINLEITDREKRIVPRNKVMDLSQ